MSQRPRAAFWLALVFCLFSCVTVFAQTAVDGAVGGTATDASGAVVPNATVVVHENATNAEQKLSTDGSGYFRAIHLQPGGYTVTVTAPGFETFRAADLTVQVGLLTSVEVKLNAGSESQTVEVTGAAPLVNTDSPAVAGVIEQDTLHNLPVNNYRWSAFALLTPGVVNDSNGYGLLSFRGQSTLLNNITIDGTDDNQAFFSEERGRTRAGYSTIKEAVQEFQVNTSNYSVEYGRSAGGIVNSVTKSGTNSFHGTGYLFDRDGDWNAINSSVTHAVETAPGKFTVVPFQPTDLRRQYGFSVGGPFLKDRLFFFLAGDRFYHDFPGTATPLGASANANFYGAADAALPGGKTCGTTTGTAAPSYQDANVCQIASNTGMSYAAAYGIYNNGIQGLSSMLGTTPRVGDQTLWFPKIDWQVNSHNHASIEANRMRWTSPAGIQTSPAVAYGKSSFGNDYVRDNWIVGKLDTFITSSVSNQIRYMYGRDFEFESNQAPTAYEQTNLVNTPSGYVNPLGLPTNVYLSGFFQFGTPQFLERASYPDERRWQIADSVEWIRGNHDFKFGEDYIHTYDLLSNLYNQYGGYSYSGNTLLGNYISDLYLSQNPVAGKTAQHFLNYTQGAGLPGLQMTTNDYAAFVQDQWKVSRRLSVTLGIRWDYESFPSAQLPNALLPQTSKLNSSAANVAPRVGFAYDASGNGRTIVRGGYGMFYARAINSTLYQALVGTGAAGSQSNPTLLPGGACTPVFPQVVAPQNQAACLGAAGGNVTADYLDPNFKIPQIHQADLTVEQQISQNDVFSISWLGSWGRRLPDTVDTNLPTPTSVPFTVVTGGKPGPLPNGYTFNTDIFFKTANANGRPNPNFSSITDIFSGVNSNYEAFVAQFKHRLSHYVDITANYTWSHALDYGENNLTGASANDVLDPANFHAEYGNSNQNVPNRFVVSGVLNGPWHEHGWLGYIVNDFQLSPSFYFQTGLPYSVGISGASSTLTPAPGAKAQSIITTSSFNGSGGTPNRVPVFGRNAVQQPEIYNADLRASKRFVWRERYSFEFLGEAFNIANHQNVSSVNSSAYFVTNTTAGATLTPYSTPFGQTTATNNSNFALSPRQLQLGVRLQF
ncbi:TonB-dependent receptor domain-containing protein [Silvibacterium acidisoli]|uniref:TonB-dependent receptor domain-containing protein n=1 Tax=Acidobacteriaceae bacterium ZG23-2 TaxID=2883246 RepID=UPI00406C9ADB